MLHSVTASVLAFGLAIAPTASAQDPVKPPTSVRIEAKEASRVSTDEVFQPIEQHPAATPAPASRPGRPGIPGRAVATDVAVATETPVDPDGLRATSIEKAIARASKAFGTPILYSDMEVRGTPDIGLAGAMGLNATNETEFWQTVFANWGFALIAQDLPGGRVLKLEKVDTSRRLKQNATWVAPTDLGVLMDRPAEVFITVFTLEHVSVSHTRGAITQVMSNRQTEFTQEIPGANALLVCGMGPTVATIGKIVQAMDRPPRVEAVRTAVVALRHARSRDAVKTLESLMSSQQVGPQMAGPVPDAIPFRVASDAQTNSVLLSGTAPEVERAQVILKSIDVATSAPAPTPEAEKAVVVIRLEHTTVAELYGVLSGFISRRQRAGAPGPEAVIVPDERLNALIVEAGETTLNLITALVAQLDVPLEEK